MPFTSRLVAVCFVSSIVGVPAIGHAQTPAQTPPAPAPAAPSAAAGALTPADAATLLGDWTIAAESPMGPSSYLLTLKVTDNKVAGELSNETTGKNAITDISKRGSAVLLRYSFDYQGMQVPTVITLTPNGETMTVVFDFADGAFTMNGTATKKKS